MSQYSTGLVSTTNGSSVITGTSTAWLTSGIDASDFFIAAGDTVAYTIASIDSDTQITLTANYAGSTQSGITYTAHIERFGALPIFSDNDADTPELMNEVVKFTVNQDSALGTASTKDTGTAAGEVPLNSTLVPKAGGTFTGDITAPKITASTGILFGTDTAAANTLDDYEEGTFTPVVSDAVSGGNVASCSIAVGEYTKTGRVVIASILFGNIDTTGMTGTNTLIIQSLPFVSDVSSNAVGPVLPDGFTFGTGRTGIFSRTNSGSNTAFLVTFGSGESDEDFTVAGIDDSSSDARITLIYNV